MLRSQSHTPPVPLLSSWKSKPLHTYILIFRSRRFSWARSAVHYGQSGGKGTSIGSGVFETATNLFISSSVFRKHHSAMKKIINLSITQSFNHKLINHFDTFNHVISPTSAPSHSLPCRTPFVEVYIRRTLASSIPLFQHRRRVRISFVGSKLKTSASALITSPVRFLMCIGRHQVSVCLYAWEVFQESTTVEHCRT